MARDVPPNLASGIGVAATIKALSSLNLPPISTVSMSTVINVLVVSNF